jgi:drug/metabolite transporter superfamily protein YnfA
VREAVTVWGFLALAALLEAGGDAAIRLGLRGRGWGLLAGPLLLVAYGFMVNQPRWDFGRLIGTYIAIFFVVAQLFALLVDRQRPPLATVVGGALIVAGGLVLTFWRPAAG